MQKMNKPKFTLIAALVFCVICLWASIQGSWSAINTVKAELQAKHQLELVNAHIKQGEAAEYAYKVGQRQVNYEIIKLCDTKGVVDLGPGILTCSVSSKD